MDDKEEHRIKKKILEFYAECSPAGEVFSIYPREFAKRLGEGIDDVARCRRFLLDSGDLKGEQTKSSSGNLATYKFRITDKGKESLRTVFNPKWVEDEGRRKREEQRLETRKIRAAETNARWIKAGAVAAIIAGAVAVVHLVMAAAGGPGWR